MSNLGATGRNAAIPTTALSWHPCDRVSGYGVASGLAASSPYPAGTIALQLPHFARLGLDLSACFPGTINLVFPGSSWVLSEPFWQTKDLNWTDQHPPETFSFWPCLLRWRQASQPLEGWIYWPHPETKRLHHQPPDRLEVLAPWIPSLATVENLELGVDQRCCRRLQPQRLRARLLEFLKFRVLAAQESFFVDFEGPQGIELFRSWLGSQGSAEALALSDQDLENVLCAARSLYVN